MGFFWQEYWSEAISSFRVSSQLWDWTLISCIAGEFFTTRPPGKPIKYSAFNENTWKTVRCGLVDVNVVIRSSWEPHPVSPLGAAVQDLLVQWPHLLYRPSPPRIRSIVCAWLPFTSAVNKLDLLLFSQSLSSTTCYKISCFLHFATHIM